MIRLRCRAIIGALVTVAALGGHSSLSTAAGTRTITVKDDLFAPKKVTVSRNTLVTWRWASGSGEHDVVSRGTRKFKNSAIKGSGTHKIRFKKAGTYKYVCTLHEDDGMTGQITVR